MNLSKAKEVIKFHTSDYFIDIIGEQYEEFKEAIDILLKAVENSIPKDEQQILEAYRSLKKTTGKSDSWIICDPSSMHSDYFIPKSKIEKRIKYWKNKSKKDSYNSPFHDIRIRELQQLLGE